MKTKTTIVTLIVNFLFLILCGALSAEVYQIPATTASAITIDGNLSEWGAANWIPLNKAYYQTVSDVTNAKWAAYWSPQANLIYVAVTAQDSVSYLDNSFIGWDSADAVEIYIDAGNNNAAGNNYADYGYDYAQHFIAGIKPTTGSWVVMSDGTSVPNDLIVGYAASYTMVGGSYVYSYEFAITPYSYYTGLGGNQQPQTVVDLEVDTIIGLDVVLSSRYGTGPENFGMLCNNTLTHKFMYPGNFQDYKLVVSIGENIPMLETDAHFYNETGPAWNATNWHAQSYKPIKPYLYAVDFYFEQNTSASGTFTLEIWENNPTAGANADPRVGSSPIAVATVSQLTAGSAPNNFVRWIFNPVVNLSSYVGQAEKLLFLLKTTNTGIKPMLNNLGDTPPFAYEDGKYYYITNTTSWQRVDNYDMAFRTLAVSDPSAIGDAVLDQNQPTVTNGIVWDSNNAVGQSFEPQYPYLYGVKIFPYPSVSKFNLQGNYSVEVWPITGSSGTYADPRRASAPLGVATVNFLKRDAAGWVTFEFTPPLDISQYYLIRPTPLMLLFKSDKDGFALHINVNNPYASGVLYTVSNVQDPNQANWSWTKWVPRDLTFQTYGGYSPLPTSCGKMGVPKLAGDLSGPDGNPDCYIDLYDLLAFVRDWLDCTDPQIVSCRGIYF